MSAVLPILALAAIVAAVGFFLSARAAKAALATRAEELRRMEAEAESAHKVEREARAEARERREEASSLRAELASTKKRAFDQQESAKRLGGAPAIREELDKVSGRLAEARAEAEHQAERVRAAEKELEKAKEQLERLKAAAERREQAPPAPAPVPKAEPHPDAEAVRAANERAEKAEAKATEARRKLAELEAEGKKFKGRLETERRVFMVQKGELDLANDRYAELRRRHDQLRRDHDELLDAVRQAAREDRKAAEAAGKGAATPAPIEAAKPIEATKQPKDAPPSEPTEG
jgi:colicin import membrane protein